MSPRMMAAILQGDARMLPLANCSVHCVVTSPPYWGQRKYRGRALIWDAKNGCRHRWGQFERGRRKDVLPEPLSRAGRLGTHSRASGHSHGGRFCKGCGAWRGQLGLEPTPQLYVAHLVEIYREARRVLKPDGTLWLVLSDSRPSNKGAGGRLDVEHSPKQRTNTGSHHSHDVRIVPPSRRWKGADLKYSDMLGLPHDVVKGLRADGWYWRDEIIWRKPNGFCESVRTRTTRNHEYIFLLTKSPSPDYFFDVEAIMEACTESSGPRLRRAHSGTAYEGHAPHSGVAGPRRNFNRIDREGVNSRMHQDRDPNHPEPRKSRSGNKVRLLAGRGRTNNHLGFNVPWEGLWRRKRSVWSVAVTKPRGLRHYATFPEKLIEPMILAGCPKFGIVLDPCAGAGTVAVVARRLGRRSVLLELSAEYCRMAARRLAHQRQEKAQ